MSLTERGIVCLVPPSEAWPGAVRPVPGCTASYQMEAYQSSKRTRAECTTAGAAGRAEAVRRDSGNKEFGIHDVSKSIKLFKGAFINYVTVFGEGV